MFVILSCYYIVHVIIMCFVKPCFVSSVTLGISPFYLYKVLRACSVCCMMFLVRPPPYKAEASVSMLDLRQKYKLPSDKKRERYAVSTGDIFRESLREEPRPPYVIGSVCILFHD